MSRSVSALCVFGLATLAPLGSAVATPAAITTTKDSAPSVATAPAPRKPGGEISNALGVIDLKIQMAESSYKLHTSPKTLSALVQSLEEYLNTECLATLPKTLEYKGGPTDPGCVARMEQLLNLNPNNPAALCVRDGIATQTCLRAYRGQVLERFDPNGPAAEQLSEPALRIGLSSSDSKRIEEYRENLKQLQGSWESAQSDAERQKLMDDAAVVYERMLNIACRIFGLSFRERADGISEGELPAVTEARRRLLQVPPSMREDYQLRQILEIETKLTNAKLQPKEREELVALLAMAKDPEGRNKSNDAESLTRVRTVLPSCYDTIEQARSAIPSFPPPLCHAEGWYTPQCILSLKQWRSILVGRAQKLPSPTGTGKPAKRGVISTF